MLFDLTYPIHYTFNISSPDAHALFLDHMFDNTAFDFLGVATGRKTSFFLALNILYIMIVHGQQLFFS